MRMKMSKDLEHFASYHGVTWEEITDFDCD